MHIVDDDDAVRISLTFLLETVGFRVHAYASGMTFLSAVHAGEPGCVVTDVRLPDIDGLELQRRLAASGGILKVIVITGHSDVPMAVQALKDGATDFLEKPFADDTLLNAVRRAVAASQAAYDQIDSKRAAAAQVARLTAREREVLKALVSGHANKEIARDLGVSPRTVEVHRARVMEKMTASSLPELIHAALAAGVLPVPGHTDTD